MKILDK